jgi:hypothetical protein
MNKRIYWLLILLLSSVLVFSQGNSRPKKDSQLIEKQTIFGLNVSPIIPSNFIQKNDYTFQSDSVKYSLNNRPSVSFGAEIRHYFTYRFAINTGILYTKRNINVDYESHYPSGSRGTDTTFTRDLKFIAYEIPIQASGYVRLSNKIYMSIAGGINLNFYPTNIRVENIAMQRIGTQIGKQAWQFFQLGLNLNIGWEYRTKEDGYIYIGATYQSRFDDMAAVLIYEEETIHTADYSYTLRGGYLSVNLKYFFPFTKSKNRL